MIRGFIVTVVAESYNWKLRLMKLLRDEEENNVESEGQDNLICDRPHLSC
jgi:hypothetical protein